MKIHFSEKSKKAILNRYGSAENYYNYSLLKEKELSSKSNISKTSRIMASYKIDLMDPYGHTINRINVFDDEYILDVAGNYGIDLPYSDRAGTSSTCAAKLVNGVVDQSNQSFLEFYLNGKKLDFIFGKLRKILSVLQIS